MLRSLVISMFVVFFAPQIAIASDNNMSSSAFAQCLDNLQTSFAKKGIKASTFKAHRPISFDPSVIDSLNYQPEFKKEPWDYLSMLVDEERVADGINAKNANMATLKRIEETYKVNMHHVLGVWGVESNFGKTLGKKNLFSSLASLSCAGRRQAYFQSEYANALKIVQNGDVRASDMVGSWAGAFGQTQFMPSTFLELAVDFDGDGRRDIVRSVADSLASTAKFLTARGYKVGEPWGFEVKKPAGVFVSTNRKDKKPIAYWKSQGYTLANGEPLPNTLSSAGILAPAGNNGPIFLVGKNFDVFYAYNASENYALAIAHLADLIEKKQTQTTNFYTPWPTDDAGISRRQAREIQQALIDAGYQIGVVDGIIGDNTRQAIKDYQSKHGVTPDGHAGQKFYRLIMTSYPTKSSVNLGVGSDINGESPANITYAMTDSVSPSTATQIASVQMPVVSAYNNNVSLANTNQVSMQNRNQNSGYQNSNYMTANTSLYNVAYEPVNAVNQQWVKQAVVSYGAEQSYRISMDKNGKKILVPLN